jgi:hypothetical protein
MHNDRPRVITFKTQREISEERQQKLQEEYNALKEETKKILEKNREIANSFKNDVDDVTLSNEEIQRINELRNEIRKIFENAEKRLTKNNN